MRTYQELRRMKEQYGIIVQVEARNNGYQGIVTIPTGQTITVSVPKGEQQQVVLYKSLERILQNVSPTKSLSP